VLILTRREVEDLLDLDRLIEAIGAAMAALSQGSASMPPRGVVIVPARDGVLAAMPAYLPGAGALTTKMVSVFPQNSGTVTPTHQAVIVAFDPATGTPAAVMDGTEITAMRTAAGSALSARLLARQDASVLAIVGTGVQAWSHGLALPRVRAIVEGRIAGRNTARAQALAGQLTDATGIPFAVAASTPEALAGADIVCATTHSPDPVIRRQWLSPGMHVTSVGVNSKGRELDAQTVADSLVVVESRAAALAPAPSGANDLTWAIRDGVISEDHIHAEIGEIVGGTKPGRTSDKQITLYKSVGVAVQDAAAAGLVLEAAEASGAGTEFII
jgi:alanine dehydrogenase